MARHNWLSLFIEKSNTSTAELHWNLSIVDFLVKAKLSANEGFSIIDGFQCTGRKLTPKMGFKQAAGTSMFTSVSNSEVWECKRGAKLTSYQQNDQFFILSYRCPSKWFGGVGEGFSHFWLEFAIAEVVVLFAFDPSSNSSLPCKPKRFLINDNDLNKAIPEWGISI